MLDLNAIADRRAEALSQESEAWRAAVWSGAFQDLSARLSDGEVAELLSMCASARALALATDVLVARDPTPELTPLDWLKAEAAAAGLAPADWVERLPRGSAR